MLTQSVQYFRGIGPKRAELLRHLGIETARDIVLYYPRRWEDRKDSAGKAPAEGEPLVVQGRITSARLIMTKSRLGIFRCQVRAPTWGEEPMEFEWFKRLSHRYDVFQKIKEDLKPGADIWLICRYEPALLQARKLQVEEHYLVDDPKSALHVNRIVPVYSLTEGLSETLLRELAHQASELIDSSFEIVPRAIIQKRKLLAADQALKAIHFPSSMAELEAARRRLSYEELLLLELAWTLKQRQTKAIHKGYGYTLHRNLLTPFREQLGFELTKAQKHVINEIFADMEAQSPMTRLLQGDVGSGKTVVAVAALLLAVENGYQGAFMAPTEILAEQHYWTLRKLLRGLPVEVALLTSKVSKDRAKTLQRIKSGEAQIIVGTHALLETDVEFANLKLSVIDEQHRFGVRQRATLRQKGEPMDLLLMTATPIPRTLALALFGDLDVSTIDELPPGRATTVTRQGIEREALERVRKEAAAKRQSYIVYPIIAESERLDIKAAEAEYERLRAVELKDLRVGLVHGRLPAKAKAKAMDAFVAGELDVLVATPVVEVGVDVPNATTMIVQHAERFGLASLHQLRGRIGRGDAPSEYWLVTDPKTPSAQRRVQILCETGDGFKIGEEDLKLRGPGEILGTSQHGELELKAADLLKDADLQADARADARELLSQDPALSRAENARLRGRLVDLYQKKWRTIDLA